MSNIDNVLTLIKAYEHAFTASENPSDWAVAGVFLACCVLLEDLNKKNDSKEIQINSLLESNSQLNEQITQKEGEISKLKNENSELKAKLKDCESILNNEKRKNNNQTDYIIELKKKNSILADEIYKLEKNELERKSKSNRKLALGDEVKVIYVNSSYCGDIGTIVSLREEVYKFGIRFPKKESIIFFRENELVKV